MRLRDVCVSMLIAAVVAQTAAAGQPGRAGQGGLAAIEGCLEHLDPQSGSDEVAVRCPDLIRRLEASDSAAWLPAGWAAPSNDLSAASLIDLRQLIGHQLLLRTTLPPPDLGALKSILTDLGSTEPRATGAWTRFTRWLREALERGDAAPASSWWDTARVGPSQTLIDLICYGCLAAVVIMAVALIVNELRLAGAFARRPDRMGSEARRAAVAVASDWGAIQNAPARDRPRLLLELIAARLMELDRLPPAGGFTVRELLQQARLSQGEDRSLLADVALAAERVRFAEEPMSAASLETAVEGGRRLLEHLSS